MAEHVDRFLSWWLFATPEASVFSQAGSRLGGRLAVNEFHDFRSMTSAAVVLQKHLTWKIYKFYTDTVYGLSGPISSPNTVQEKD